MRRLRTLFADLRRDRSGLALIEFAFVVPFMLLLYLGGYQISDAIACNRKVTIATRAVADLASQYSILSPSTVDTILAASTEIMTPYDATKATLRVTEISTNGSGQGKIVWSRGSGIAGMTPGANYTLPSTMAFPNVSYIYGEVAYTYTPLFSSFMPTKTLTQTLYMVPRSSSDIPCDNCSN